MPIAPRLRTALFLVAAATTACVLGEGDFPSLAPRPEEQATSMEPPVRPPVAVASDPDLLDRIAALRARAAEGEAAFVAALGATETAVAAAGDAQSESWVAAQQALSRLESARAPTTVALAELDRLAIDRAAIPTSGSDFAALREAMADVAALTASQQARWDRLQARLGA